MIQYCSKHTYVPQFNIQYPSLVRQHTFSVEYEINPIVDVSVNT